MHKDVFEMYETEKSLLHKKVKHYKKVNLLLNVFTILAGFATTVLTSVILSRLVTDQVPSWFFYATTGISATTTLATTLLGFFVVKETIASSTKSINRLDAEMLLYTNKASKRYQNKSAKQNEYNLYLAIAKQLGSTPARKELSYGK